MKNLKVALVHDYIKEYGGAERVLEVLHELYPDAPVFTSAYLPQFLGPHKERFKNWDIRTSWFQHIPFNHKLISPFRLIAPFVFKHFDLSEFDVVIVSATGAYFPNNIKTKGLHVCYCHTPPRYLYGYATARDWKKHKVFAVLGAITNHFLRIADFNASKNVDYYIANSEEISSRIQKFYRRESTVIYPPVEINSKLKIQNSELKKGNYFLTGGRLARAKHTDLIIKACEELDVPLKVFGRGFAGYEQELRRFAEASPLGGKVKSQNKNSKIEFLGEVSDVEKFALMKNARAFIFAGEDEDFGIVPVEAMSTGLPVIAFKSGGVKETVIDGITGVFFDELNSESLKKAIQKFDKIKINPEDCRQQAEKFSKEKFIKEIKEFINAKINNNKLSFRAKQSGVEESHISNVK